MLFFLKRLFVHSHHLWHDIVIVSFPVRLIDILFRMFMYGRINSKANNLCCKLIYKGDMNILLFIDISCAWLYCKRTLERSY